MAAKTLVDLFEEACNTYKKADALLFKQAGRYSPISSEELKERVTKVGIALAKLGIDRGDRVALLSENRPEWAVADMGMLSIGAVNVPFYPTLPAAQIRDLMVDCGARAIVVSNADLLARVLSVVRQMPDLKTIILMDHSADKPDWVLSFSDLLTDRGGDSDKFMHLRRQVCSDDVATIIYTSGTTGQPKGVMLTHRNIVSNVLDSAEAFEIDSTDVALSFLPLSHIFERMFDYLMIHRGVTVAYAESFDAVGQNLQEIRPTVVACVPRFFEKLYTRINDAIKSSPYLKRELMSWSLGIGRLRAHALIARRPLSAALKTQYALANWLILRKLRQKLGGRIRFFISGGAPLDQQLAEFFFSANILILEGYGLTETSPVIAVNRVDQFKFGTVGQVLRQVELKMAEDGEVLVRGPSVMKGYYKRESETREVLRDGWFYTGDIGILDAEKFLRITGRKKDLIVTASGKNVAPQKIESLLKTNPYFIHVVAVGNKRPFVSALVVPNAEKVKTQAASMGIPQEAYEQMIERPEIKQFLLRQIQESTRDLAPFEQIKTIQIVPKELSVDEGELTPKMSVRRQIVEEKYKHLIDKMYAS